MPGHDPEPAPGRDAAAVLAYLERYAAVLTEGGIPRMPARVFAALMVTDSGRLTAAELAGMLQASPAAISGAIRYLGQIHLVSRQREPGSRRDHYQVHEDIWQDAVLSQDVVMSRWVDSAREGAKLLGPDTPAGRRMAESQLFYEFVLTEMPQLVDRWRAHRARLRGDQ